MWLVRAAVIALAAALVYFNSLTAPFIFDDEVAVVANPAIRSISGAWSQPRDTPLAGRPVAAVTFAVNFAASDGAAAAYRATNIAIHIACALLFFGLLRRTLLLPRLRSRFGGAATDLAFGAALLWAVHPLTTDAVTYITQRTESLMALCYLSTLYASLRSGEKHSTPWAVAAVSACAIGMGAKESMATAPLMVILYDRIFLFDSFRASRGAAVAALSRPDAHVAASRISARSGPARRLCRILYGHLCLDVPLESIRDDLPVSAARRVADGSRHHVRRTRRVRPFRCPHRIGDCGLVAVVDRGRISPMADRCVSRCVVLHDAGALIELHSDRHRGRRRTADVFAADGLDHRRRRGSLWFPQSSGHARRELWPRSVFWLRRRASDWRRWHATPNISPG